MRASGQEVLGAARVMIGLMNPTNRNLLSTDAVETSGACNAAHGWRQGAERANEGKATRFGSRKVG